MQLFKYLVWALLMPFTILIGLFGRFCAPIVCLFVVRKMRYDTVKRLGKQKVLLERDDIVSWLSWFSTHDNDLSEWWFGKYNEESIFWFARKWTQQDYDNSRVIRWFCRVMWLQRNSMYTFMYRFFSISKDSKLAWQYKGNAPIGFGYQMHINVGYKSFKGFDRLMYAGRPIGRITKI